LIAYGPLAGGRLTGKYQYGARPANARYSMWPGKKSRHLSNKLEEVITYYNGLASSYGVSLAILSTSFVLSRKYVNSMVAGAKTLQNMQDTLKCLDIELSQDILKEIDAIHRMNPNPIFMS
jgi:hypothetical protein